MSAVRLVATDLDGTLLRADLTVSPRTRAALDAVRAAGVRVVPVTARQPYGLREIAAAAGFAEWALCSNGALGLHLSDGRLLFDTAIAVPVQETLAAAVGAAVPGVVYGSVRDRGTVFVAQDEYAAISVFADHKLDPRSMVTASRAAVLAEPSLKLVLRHPDIAPAALLALVRELDVDGVEVTSSGAPFLEVQAAGVTKASGLARLCAELGIDREEVVAFGDAPNDVELLRWAGRGVAVANAGREALDAADEVTGSNEDDGVAKVLERLL
jgi:Cof subfamily protein (haloacid dehalogenase superfamily)